MANILRYGLSVIIPVGYLIWLAFVLYSHPNDQDILDTTHWVVGLLYLTAWIMPARQGRWWWFFQVPSFLMAISGVWFYFRLSPIDDRHSMFVWIIVAVSFGGGITLCDMAYRKWWPNLPFLLKVFFTTAGIIISGGAVLYLLSVILKDVNWRDVLITNWYVTLLVLYLPVFLGVLFVRNALEKHKIERKP
jgi:hypothetical protein